MMFPPAVTVSGLLVLYLKVSAGIFNVIASSCNPQGSVKINEDFEVKNRKSRYPYGLIIWACFKSFSSSNNPKF